MKQSELNQKLEQLKLDLAEKPNRKAITSIISRQVNTINECLEYGYSRKNIYDFLFSEEDKEAINFKYFSNNILYRARKKSLKKLETTNKLDNFATNEKKEIIQDNKKLEKQSFHDPFSRLSEKKEKPLHNSSSDKEALERRVEELLLAKQNKETKK